MHFQQYKDRSWGLLHTKYCCEKQVSTILENNAIPCYLPVVKRVRSRKRTIYEPIYGGYLFAAWKQEDRKVINHCSNVINYIETHPGEDSGIIEQMESLYKIEMLSEKQEVNLKSILQLPNKQLKKIKSGPMAGFSGYWKEVNNKMMFAVIMNVMGSQFEATIDGADLVFD